MSSTYFPEQQAADYAPSDAVLRASPAPAQLTAAVFGVFPAPSAPKTPLAEYRVLAPTVALRVSPLCLGAMSVGNQWAALGSKMGVEEAFAFLDAFYDAGGNFIDTANAYQGESFVRVVVSSSAHSPPSPARADTQRSSRST